MREMGKSIKWPWKMNALPEHRDPKLRCEFHGDHGHRTEDCIALKFEVAELLKQGHLREFLTDKGKQTYARRDDQRQTGSVDSPPEPPRQDRVINCISGGSEVSGVSYSAAKRHTRQVSNAEIQPNREHPSKVDETVTFRSTDKSDLFSPHHDALVISLHIANCLTKRILIDNGSSCNILFNNALREMQVDESKLSRRTTMLTGFSGEQKSTLGEIVLPVYAEGVNLYINFLVLDCQSPYNAILGRPWIHELKAIPSTYHQLIKFPTKWGVKEIKGEQRAARECYQNALKRRTGIIAITGSHGRVDSNQAENGGTRRDDIRKQLVEFLRERRNSFTWSHEDMIGIDPEVMVHRLQVDPDHQPVKQKRRKFAPERNKVINEEIQKLFDIGSVREVKYPDWLANVVVVKKKNGKWRVCIDFTDLNKACPKDSFPLPHIDMLVDATAGHELLSFMDAYSGYNQILMHPDDQEKTAFITERGIFCYKVMPFGLKNAGATYQRLVNKMFAKMLGSTMEVYIDDMLVKSLVAQQHIDHLRQSFDVLDQYGMKLNPTKCSFGVSSGKFLGYLVTQRGVEANPDQIRSIENIKSPKCMKDVQKLTGRVAALNRFISKSSKKCLPFFNILRKNKAFEWNDDSVSAVLVREEGRSQHPVYYVSKTLLDAETRYSRLEKLALALVMAARKLRPYFQCHSIKVLTAYPLKNILHKPELSGRLTKWAVELSEYDISFHPRSAMKSQVLADFITDFTPGESVHAEQELVALTVTSGIWTLSVDGSSSIKGSGLGLVLESPQGDILEQSVHCGFHATNNEAEYEALIAGLDLAKSLSVKIIKVRSDSQLVVRQVNGTYEARDQRMSAYLNKVKQLQSTFDEFSIEQIPRSENTRADALASLGSTTTNNSKSVPIIHLMSPSIQESETVAPVDNERSWIEPIFNYLQADILPGDRAEARRIKAKAAKFASCMVNSTRNH
ncbi:hypothetical protein LWI29_006363 [Acer saccharum]|uniref:RNA-directed DNA polymerase n=1 Tax=Acer saccharum TaxID=4024 RepID=A0AA39V8N6_ACESA|nr:hypothetical protein LWI29_006363 [Acer saccharum]